MENQVVFYNSVRPQIETGEIYRRLGYVSRTGEEKKRDIAIADDISDALSVAECRAAVKRLVIDDISGEKIITAGSGAVSFESRDLCTMLRGCTELLIMGATISGGFMDMIKERVSGERLASAVIYDAVGAVCVDNCLDWLVQRLRSDCLREGKDILPRRFSAGFGDFGLSNQKKIYDILGMDRMGVMITDTFLLVPEKSVTAITGIK